MCNQLLATLQCKLVDLGTFSAPVPMQAVRFSRSLDLQAELKRLTNSRTLYFGAVL